MFGIVIDMVFPSLSDWELNPTVGLALPNVKSKSKRLLNSATFKLTK